MVWIAESNASLNWCIKSCGQTATFTTAASSEPWHEVQVAAESWPGGIHSAADSYQVDRMLCSKSSMAGLFTLESCQPSERDVSRRIP